LSVCETSIENQPIDGKILKWVKSIESSKILKMVDTLLYYQNICHNPILGSQNYHVCLFFYILGWQEQAEEGSKYINERWNEQTRSLTILKTQLHLKGLNVGANANSRLTQVNLRWICITIKFENIIRFQ
jgi:hypothetical protein